MGAGKSLNRREKNSGEEKSRRRVRAPGDKVLSDQFQTVGAILASETKGTFDCACAKK